jgi:hypothetical protein
MTNSDTQRANIKIKLETLSILEKCEFEKRVKIVLNSKLSKKRFVISKLFFDNFIEVIFNFSKYFLQFI